VLIDKLEANLTTDASAVSESLTKINQKSSADILKDPYLANKLKVAMISLDPLAYNVDPELTKGLLSLRGDILEKFDPVNEVRK